MAGRPQQHTDTPVPEPVFVPMMVGWPVIAACGVFTVAGLFQAANRYSGPLSPWWLALLGATATLIAAKEARTSYPATVYGNLQCDLAGLVATLVGLAVTGWWVWTGYIGIVDTWAHLALLTLLGTTLWWGLLWNGQRIDAHATVDTPDTILDDDIDWPALLRRVDHGAHQVAEIETHRAGAALICHPLDQGGKLPTYAEFMNLSKPFATVAAMEMRRRGGRLPVNAVRTAPGRDDAEYRMEITTRDVFSGVSPPYQQDLTAQDIARPLDLGELETGDRITVKLLYRHTQITGATDAGKSVLANNFIGRITGCGNALVWVGATDKLTPLVWPWLRCYFDGRAERPVLDWVAGMDVRRVLVMLAAAYRLACERNALLADDSKISPTAQRPAVYVILEETSHAMEFSDWIITHDGLKCTVSKLVKLIVRAGRSAGVHVILISQVALNEAFGAEAPTIKRQLSVRFCLRTNEDYDGYKTLAGLSGSVRTTQLANNTLLFQQVREGAEVARAIPGKAALLDGTQTISHIAERHARWRPQLESTVDLGEDYATRWDQEANPELSRVVGLVGLSWRTPGPARYQPADPVPPPAQPPVPDDIPDDIPEGDTLYRTEPPQEAYEAMFEQIARHFTVADPRNPPPPVERTVLGLPRPEDSKLFATLDDIIANPKGVEPDPRDELPSPLGPIRRFLRAHPELRFVTTEELQGACGDYGDTVGERMRLGRDIYSAIKLNSRNPRVDERRDTRNKGYNSRELWEAIERARFGMP